MKKKSRAATSRRKSASARVDDVSQAVQGIDLMQSYVRQNVEAARAGDEGAARAILSDFVGAVDARSERAWPTLSAPIDWAYARFLADAFQRILNGADAAVALGVKNSRAGRRTGTRTHDREALAAAYWLIRRKGIAPERAAGLLGKRTGADRRTIQRASVENGNAAYRHPKLIPDDDLKAVAKPYAAAIAAILAAERRR